MSEPKTAFLAGFDGVHAKLWPHQRRAVHFVAEYLSRPRTEREGARLISLPTGSGKSGIIATVSRYIPLRRGVLVVVPRLELRTQLFDDINGRFFEHARVGHTEHPKRVVAIRRSKDFWAGKTLRRWAARTPENAAIAVVTIQLLQRVWERAGRLALGRITGARSPAIPMSVPSAKSLCEHLLREIGLVIFDEGHYEPAPQWATVIRSFPAHRVVFTATPFRNDLRSFDWATARKDVFYRSFRSMVDAGYIRDIRVEPLTAPLNDLQAVVTAIEERRQALTETFAEHVEVIVRVGSRARVLELADAIRSKGLAYRAVHHRGTLGAREARRDDSAAEPIIHRSYSEDQKGDVHYWIHQNKLLEGIDRPAISLLVILDPLRSIRAVVQQVGRLTRLKHNDRARPYALVLDTTGELDHLWRRFETLETSLMRFGFEGRTSREVVTSILAPLAQGAAASPIYSDGRVRDLLEPREDLAPWDSRLPLDWRSHLLVPKTAQVLQMAKPEIDWPRTCSELLKDCNKRFSRTWTVTSAAPLRVVGSHSDDVRTEPFVLLGVSAIVSPLLLDHAFFDVGLELVLACRLDPYVFYYDSAGANLRGIAPFLRPCHAQAIISLLRSFDGQRLRSVSTLNTRSGPTTTTSRTYGGVDLTRIPSSLDDATHVVTAAAGYAEGEDDIETTGETQDGARDRDSLAESIQLRRYVGVRSRRVSDSGPLISVGEYLHWATGIADLMRAASRTNASIPDRASNQSPLVPFFRRFAPEAGRIPKGWQPQWLTVDLSEYEGEYVLKRSTGTHIANGPLPQPGEARLAFPILEDGLTELNKTPGAARWSGRLAVVRREPIDMEVTFNPRVGHYQLHSAVLDSYRKLDRPDGNTVLQELNQSQAYSIVPKEEGFFYTMGTFFRPGIKLGPDYDDAQTGLLEMTHRIPGLRSVHSEKGPAGSAFASWPESSLFGLLCAAADGRFADISSPTLHRVAESLHAQLGKVEWLVCDDMGGERADFIALTQRHGDRVILLIHAKARTDGESQLSAKQIQVVCAQAMKNLDFLGPRLADHSRNWAKAWTDKEGVASVDRLRIPTASSGSERAALAKQAHEVFAQAVSNPRVRREVWLLLGASLSARQLESVLKKAKRTKTEVPPIYLLYATSSIVASSNALLRVFCH